MGGILLLCSLGETIRNGYIETPLMKAIVLDYMRPAGRCIDPPQTFLPVQRILIGDELFLYTRT